MEGYKEAILDLAKDCNALYVTGSRRITSRPCFVFSAVITPDNADNKSQVHLRNGETALGDILFSFKARYSHPLHYACPPVYFNRGLYVDIVDNVDGITIQYIEDLP